MNREFIRLGYHPGVRKRRGAAGIGESHKMKKPLKMHVYRLPGDWTVWAGKTDDDNDAVSLKLASPKDWWFHVRGMPGSHVVLHHETEPSPDRAILKLAAAIAAYHSKAGGGGTVNVAYTRACNVTKPKGSKSGTVHIRRERLIKTRPEIPSDVVKED